MNPLASQLVLSTSLGHLPQLCYSLGTGNAASVPRCEPLTVTPPCSNHVAEWPPQSQLLLLVSLPNGLTVPSWPPYSTLPSCQFPVYPLSLLIALLLPSSLHSRAPPDSVSSLPWGPALASLTQFPSLTLLFPICVGLFKVVHPFFL